MSFGSVNHIRNEKELNGCLEKDDQQLVVLDFSATWCGPCKAIAPVFDGWASEYPKVLFCKVDVDECEELSENYGISAMPTFIFLKGKEKLETIKGANKDAVKAAITKYSS